MNIINRGLSISRSFGIFVLTLAASVVVIGAAAYYSHSLDPLGVAWRALVIAVLVSAGAGWITREPAATRQAAPAIRQRDDGPRGTVTPIRAPSAGDSLEEQGITARLLELIALGDRYGNGFSLALIRLDHLEEIDRRCGPEVADQLLERVSRVLAHTLRMPDRLGHFGRGAHIVVFPETTLPGALQIAERLRTAVAELDVFASSRVQIYTTASIGVTSFRRGDDLRGLLERAERTLDSAVRQGRNRVLPDIAA